MQGTVNQRLCTARAREKLRILQIGKFYPPHMGGIETHLHALCGELRQSVDLKVIVANESRKGSTGGVDGVEVTRLGTLFNFAGSPVCRGMVRSIRQAEADIVHLHLPNPTAVLAYLASGRKGPLIITYHSDVVRQKVLGKAFEPFLHWILRRSAAIITSSPDIIASSAVLSAYRDRCRIIPFGIPQEQFRQPDPATVARLREAFGPTIVLGVGRLVYYKGFEYLIRAMSRVKGRLVIVGEGPLRATLEKAAKRYGVADRVTLVGNVDDVVPYYHACDIFALPSVARSEALGIVQIEAMTCGKPVVNTFLKSGVPFVSQHGITGLTVPPADADALATAINLLLNDPECREAYGRAGQGRAQREFSLDMMTQRTLQLYNEVLRSVPTQKRGPSTSGSRDGRAAAFVSAGSPAG